MSFAELLPYYLWIPGGTVALLCYLIAFHLVYPLRRLHQTVERFGQGDLAARVAWKRKDELGALGRAFDRMAERIDTLLTAERRLLQDVSHELRSPLARLGFAIELARSSPDRQGSLDRIRKESDRLTRLVDELIEVTRAEGDPASRPLADVSLDTLLKETADDCSMEAEARECHIRLSLESRVALRGDCELLRRAMENILRNAIHYAPERSDVELELARRQDGAVIHVRDYGPGVPDGQLEQIFQPFFRVETDRNRQSGGVGLGLSIASRAVQLHHGRIHAENAKPGLRVTIELPVDASAS